jgi:pimeloyl-ACP methyl ester carboxylesterase
MILHTIDSGAGAPVALLHGLFGRAQNLGSVARRLAPAMRVISIDLRNHGASPHAPGMDYETQAADVIETLAALHALPAALLGHSMGGKTAMAAALMAPHNVGRLVVADIAPVAYAHQNARIAKALQMLPLQPGMTRADADRQLLAAVPDAAVRAFLLQNFVPGTAPGWRIGLDHIVNDIATIESWPQFPPGTCYEGPALFIGGASSDYLLPSHHDNIKKLFPAARFEIIPDAGHWLHADQPEAFGTMVEQFLRQ